MKIGITCYPTYGGSGVVATELGLELAERGHEVHFISYSQPIRLTQPLPNIHYHEVEVSRYPLFEYPPYDLALATRMAEVAEIYDLDLLHVHYAIPHSVSAMLARQMLSCDHARKGRRLALRDHAARHRHHAGGLRSVVSADHPLLHRPERRRHFDFGISEEADHRGLRCADPDRGDSQLRELRSLSPHAAGDAASRRIRQAQREDPGASFELPSGETSYPMSSRSSTGCRRRFRRGWCSSATGRSARAPSGWRSTRESTTRWSSSASRTAFTRNFPWPT